MLTQQPGMSIEARAVVAVDAVLADPARGFEHIETAVLAAVTDYRRALARTMVRAGADPVLVWRALCELPVSVHERLPYAEIAPLSPEFAQGG